VKLKLQKATDHSAAFLLLTMQAFGYV